MEVEKDNLQFKRDDHTKSLEVKIKDLKKEVKATLETVSNLESENNSLQAELEKLKNIQMLE